jgi:hypothetical protein
MLKRTGSTPIGSGKPIDTPRHVKTFVPRPMVHRSPTGSLHVEENWEGHSLMCTQLAKKGRKEE